MQLSLPWEITPNRGGKGSNTQNIGCSRGGRTAQIHVIAESQGRLFRFSPTRGNIGDTTAAYKLMAQLLPKGCLIGGMAYDAQDLQVVEVAPSPWTVCGLHELGPGRRQAAYLSGCASAQCRAGTLGIVVADPTRKPPCSSEPVTNGMQVGLAGFA